MAGSIQTPQYATFQKMNKELFDYWRAEIRVSIIGAYLSEDTKEKQKERDSDMEQELEAFVTHALEF